MTFIAESPGMRAVVNVLRRIATSMCTVLVIGERGTGKDTIARALHYASARRAKPFIPVDCASIPEAMMQTEIFGYTKDAFVGATDRHAGHVSIADGGTLFLDEVSNLSTEAQKKLVRLLEARSYTPYGGSTLRANVRVVATTSQDLEAEVARGSFRRDLLGRLAMARVAIPPLRERREDIRLLAEQFLMTCAERAGRPHVREVAAAVIELFEKDAWPGNVRALENAIEHAVILASGHTIEADCLPARFLARDSAPSSRRQAEPPPSLTETLLDRCAAEALEDRLLRRQDRASTEQGRVQSLVDMVTARNVAA